MTQLLYTDHYLRYNVTYEILGKRAFSSNRNYGDLSGHTVIIITDDMAETTFIRNMADLILTRGCKNIAFCGEASEEWQDIFDRQDRDINGFNDITGYEGAETLFGNGDMFFLGKDMSKPIRIQAPFLSESDIESIAEMVGKVKVDRA